jgi:hypothetical protein
MKVAVRRKNTRTKTNKSAIRRKETIAHKKAKNVSTSYNKHKFHEGKQYTGLQVGRGLKWYYDKGEWKDAKITPDIWRINFAVTKRRAGKAPKGSGAGVGTGYHWYIVAHQKVIKLNADDYSTEMTGLKFKVAHKRAAKGTWSAKATAQRNRLVIFLKEWIKQLEQEPVTLDFLYDNIKYKGEAVALPGACQGNKCSQYEIVLNGEPMGIIRSLKNGWKMDTVKDQKLIDMIGEQINS